MNLKALVCFEIHCRCNLSRDKAQVSIYNVFVEDRRQISICQEQDIYKLYIQDTHIFLFYDRDMTLLIDSVGISL